MSDLKRSLARSMARGLVGFRMIDPGDRILVAVSGGKDSLSMLYLLHQLQPRSPVPFTILPVHVHQGQPGHDPTPVSDWCASLGLQLVVEREDTYSIVMSKTSQGDNPCVLCSRLRRAILYRKATELGCTKVALGHHRDDTIVTLMLNLVFGGQLKAMPPILRSDDGKHVVIRPLIYCAEHDLAELSHRLQFPVRPCATCGSRPNQERKIIDGLLADLEQRCPKARANMLAALANVRPSHLLDPALWRKLGLDVARDPEASRESIDHEPWMRATDIDDEHAD